MLLNYLSLISCFSYAFGVSFSPLDQSLVPEPYSMKEIGTGIGMQVGRDLDAYGDWLIVGADNRVAFMYKKNASNLWDRTERFLELGGSNVAMADSVMMLGGQSPTRVYERSVDTWASTLNISYDTSPMDTNNKPFNTIAMASSGLYAVLGNFASGGNAGEIRIYNRGSSWASPTFTTFTGNSGSRFGDSVCMSKDGTTVMACASGVWDGANDHEDYCRIYTRSVETWSLVKTLIRSDIGSAASSFRTMDDFGAYCSLDDDGTYALISHMPLSVASTVHVFKKSSPTQWGWYQGINPDAALRFGQSISYDQGRWAIGSTASYNNVVDGYVHLYYLTGGVFTEQGRLESDGTGGRCGRATAVVGSDIFAGCIYHNGFRPDTTTATVAGRAIVWENVAAFPTLAPTLSPTLSPTKFPTTKSPTTKDPTAAPTKAPTVYQGIVVGRAAVSFTVLNHTKRAEIALATLSTAKAQGADPARMVGSFVGVEQFVIPYDIYNAADNTAQFNARIAAARGCVGCVVTPHLPNRRLLSGRGLTGGSIAVTITYTLSEEAYATLISSGANPGSTAFISALATSFNVPAEDITITTVGGTITVNIDFSAVPGSNGIEDSVVAELANINSNLNAATTTLVNTFGTVETVVLDLCGGRTCNARGTCNQATGICVCRTDTDYWGINCETLCDCDSGGACDKQYCTCDFPNYGKRCESQKLI